MQNVNQQNPQGNQNFQGRGYQRGNNNAQGHGRVQNGLGNVQPVVNERLRKPNLSFHKGSLANFFPKYNFGPEGTKYLESYFQHLIKNEEKKGERFKIGLAKHHHPFGALTRSVMDGYVSGLYEPTAKMLCVGSSTTRTLSSFDPPVANQEVPLSRRVHMTCPILSNRDVIRKQDTETKLIGVNPVDLHRCECIGGSGIHCANCLPATNLFPVVKSIDSIYYDGVLEEMAIQAKGTGYKTVGYAAFNDYHAAMVKNSSRKGRCWDDESHYEVYEQAVTDNFFGPGLPRERMIPMVKSTVKGNITPYRHRIIATQGESNFVVKVSIVSAEWQFPQVCPPLEDVYCVFNELECFWNGDVPYKLFHINFIPSNVYLMYPGMECPHLHRYLETTPITHVEEVLPVSEVLERILDKPRKNEEDAFLMDDHRKATIKSLTSTYDFSRMDIDFVRSVRAWDAIVYEFKNWWSEYKTNERIVTFQKSGTLYVRAEFYKEICGTHYKKAEHNVEAPLALVVESYNAIGNKKSIDAILNATANLQKDKAEELGVGVVHVNEAMIIAKLIRAQQFRRLERLTNLSVSMKCHTK